MSEWVRVTPETMPPDGAEILVTLQDRHAGRRVFESRVVYTGGMFTTENDSGYLNPLHYFVADETVTHWAFYPSPARD